VYQDKHFAQMNECQDLKTISEKTFWQGFKSQESHNSYNIHINVKNNDF